jgi:hypothetical protein
MHSVFLVKSGVTSSSRPRILEPFHLFHRGHITSRPRPLSTVLCSLAPSTPVALSSSTPRPRSHANTTLTLLAVVCPGLSLHGHAHYPHIFQHKRTNITLHINDIWHIKYNCVNVLLLREGSCVNHMQVDY